VEGQGRFQVRPERVGAGFSRAPRRRSFLFAHLIQFYKRTMLLKFSSLQVGAFFNRYRFRCKIASGILLYRQGQKSVSYCIVRSFVSPTIPKSEYPSSQSASEPGSRERTPRKSIPSLFKPESATLQYGTMSKRKDCGSRRFCGRTPTR
jgi:hypothetical protein